MEEDEAMGLAGSAQTQNAMIAEVASLLMEGVDPQELLDRGVPPDILQKAMEMVLSQSPAGGMQTPPAATPPMTDGGLAATTMA
jgi:hypothetical protein